jgi:hypothetical protein
MAYRRIAISFPRAVLATSVIALTFIPVAWVFHGVHFPTAPSLKLLVLSSSLIGCQLVQVYQYFTPVDTAKSLEGGEWSYSSDS